MVQVGDAVGGTGDRALEEAGAGKLLNILTFNDFNKGEYAVVMVRWSWVLQRTVISPSDVHLTCLRPLHTRQLSPFLSQTAVASITLH